ncbi:M28 family peptidase [Telmatocola sphagniphila]|uniref:M28 family peptidase n=1 Tax=Telmatocola sphagniphila TaxID=1123043 RepID=A0A8E6EUZ3_9BACT|nr:M28 family peptidase [Telmatocola sphagniphila]QVL34279.1 M28 family peptidase [Telmatocola sphagniphila]
MLVYRRLALPVLCLWGLFASTSKLPAQEAAKTGPFSIDRIKTDVKYLSSDLLQGRGVGTRGEELATDYIAEQFKKAGLKPMVGKASYFQPVPLVTVTTTPTTTLSFSKGNDITLLKLEDEFAGMSYSQKDEDFEAEAIFVGHGITAPEFDWDDYKDVDVKGKVVVLFTNEPPSDDPKFFAGKALTYYGRWTYKYEEATRRGAKAALIIHTAETAGYPYGVVKKLTGAQIQHEENAPALAFAGWLSSTAGDKVLGSIGLNVDTALKQANTKGFKAKSLGITVKGHIASTVKKVSSKNVVGLVEGSDPELKSEIVLFTAHWDHLGVGKSSVGGEAIFNGALDNASGCGILIEMARTWASLNPKPKRSALFLATTAEESGLLGALYYSQHPLIPLGRTAMNFNFDTVSPIGEPESIVLSGAERTTSWSILQNIAAKHHLEIEPDKRSHLGYYYRSDHFAMARGGVPAFSVGRGEKIKGKPADFAKKASEDFIANIYHSPNDKYKEEWDFTGYPVLMGFALDAAKEIANAKSMPTWNPGDEFLEARIKSGVK